MEFKDKLRKLRNERGLSRKELGEKAGISFRSIDKYEQGIREPNLDSIKKLSDALEVNPVEFLEVIPNFKRVIDIVRANGI